jgi:hypothetical protein
MIVCCCCVVLPFGVILIVVCGLFAQTQGKSVGAAEGRQNRPAGGGQSVPGSGKTVGGCQCTAANAVGRCAPEKAGRWYPHISLSGVRPSSLVFCCCVASLFHTSKPEANCPSTFHTAHRPPPPTPLCFRTAPKAVAQVARSSPSLGCWRARRRMVRRRTATTPTTRTRRFCLCCMLLPVFPLLPAAVMRRAIGCKHNFVLPMVCSNVGWHVCVQ